MSTNNNDRMTLTADALSAAQEAAAAAIGEFITDSAPRENVLGLGVGVKWSNGQPTGEPALVVLVSQKRALDQIAKADLIPSRLQNMQTDVLSIGVPFAGGHASLDADAQTLTKRVRPAEGGYSVGHFKITAGTIATCVYDILPGGSSNPPRHGVGIPQRYYILSNNHVLANSNNSVPGDAILQPGPIDGGVDPADRIARLTRFVPIQFSPTIPLAAQNNLVDCAVAEGQFHDLNREVFWHGYVRGWRPRAQVLQMVGQTVQKTGRTTNFTTGRITVVNATVDVNYGNGQVARMKDQIVTTNMSAGGDSGSLVTTVDNVAVGLLFAGSPTAMIANQIENVRSLLRVEVAEQIL